MGFLSRKGQRTQQLQVPDELALKARAQADGGNHGAAFETYGEAIDKIHTMCVVAAPGSRLRHPGAQDQEILDGFNEALAAVLRADPGSSVANTVDRTLAYLHEIAREAGVESGRYTAAIQAIDATRSR